ncbi:MAG: hypothetical protein ABR905_06145 [Terracidiphilus sp.]
MALLFVFMAGGISSETASTASPPALTAVQIANQMQRHDQARSEKLKHLKSTRHYRVEYKGFPANLAAQMEVEYIYDAASGKSFHIVSQSGSKFLLERVLKRALDSEKEASRDKAATALTAANYKFHFIGMESLAGRWAYVLDVQPLMANKFLYRGKIWVDATEFALVKFEAEPAKSPSFWISRTLIHQSFSKTGDFWLPEQNRSETKVRIGGTAVFTIDYGSYRINADAS